MSLKDILKKSGKKLKESEDHIKAAEKIQAKHEEKIERKPQELAPKEEPEKPEIQEFTEKEKEEKQPKRRERRQEPSEETEGFARTGTKKQGRHGMKKPKVWDFPQATKEVSQAKQKTKTKQLGEVRGGPKDLFKIPKEVTEQEMSPSWQPPELKEVDERYELIEPWAYARLYWSEDEERLLYDVLEPPLSDEEEEKLKEAKKLLTELLDVNLMEITEKEKVREYLKNKLTNIIKDYEIDLTQDQYNKILYYIYRDFLGLEKIEPIMHDPAIEDISCDGVEIPIYVYHKQYGSLKTNITYEEGEELDTFVKKLAQRTGKHISVAEPLLQGALPDGSRLQATYAAGKEISMKGSTFTIRKFTEDPLTIVDQLNFGTVPPIMAAYLWITTEYKNSLLVAGGTAAGKTSMLNSLSMFIPRDKKIVSVEDTPEIRLPHEHWVNKIATTTGKAGESKRGEVSMFDLVKAGLRERPDQIIVGEVRGEEAYNLFQGMASLRGNEKVTVINPEGKTEHLEIQKLMNRDLEGYKTLSVDPNTKKTELKPIKACVEHEPREVLYKIKTATGREVTVTGDHSVFTHEEGEIKEKEVEKIKEGENLVVPAKAPAGYADKEYLDLSKELEEIRIKAPKYVKKASRKLGWKEAGEKAGVSTISDYYGEESSALEKERYNQLLEEAEVSNNPQEIEVKFERRSETHPAKLEITPELLRLIGYYISDGSLNTARKNNLIQLYNSNPKVLKDMERCIKKTTGKEPRERNTNRGYGEAKELAFNHKVFYELLKQKCGHGAKEKRIPEFIYGLSKEKISEFLTALWTGDGSCTPENFQYSTASKELANGIMHLLLKYEIVAHKYWREDKGIYQIEFYQAKEQRKFQKWIKPIDKEVEIKRAEKEGKRREKEIYKDPIKKIEKIELEEPEPVYDLSVPGTQNFTGGFGGIMLHNTGHPGLSTMHADSIQAVINRLKTKPINLSPGLLQHLDVVLIQGFTRVEGMDARRVQTVVEVVDIDMETGDPITNELFNYVPSGDYFEFVSDESYILKEIEEEKGITREDMWEELQRRSTVLKWMQENDITNFKEVGKVIAQYQSNPEDLMEKIRKEEARG